MRKYVIFLKKNSIFTERNKLHYLVVDIINLINYAQIYVRILRVQLSVSYKCEFTFSTLSKICTKFFVFFFFNSILWC